MFVGYATNDPEKPVIFPLKVSGIGYAALVKLGFFYREEYSTIIDRLILEKAAELGVVSCYGEECSYKCCVEQAGS